MSRPDFRDFVRAADDPRLQPLRDADAVSYVERLRQIPRIDRVLSEWETIFATTAFRGVTADGDIVPALFPVAPEGAPTAAAVDSATALLALLDDEQRERLRHPLDSRIWRAWMNPEIYLNRYGLRLEEERSAIRDAALALVAASLSARGYRKIRDIMHVNGYLGALVGAPQIMGEYSYNVNLFGTPSLTEPWGWQLYGHHLALNCMFVGEQMVLSPLFLGSEPDAIDAAEEPIFAAEEDLALQLMGALDDTQRASAVLFGAKRDPAMPEGRIHSADELNLAGAFQDNRVIPFEGVVVGDLDAAQQELAMQLAERMLEVLPDGPRAARMARIRAHLDATRFCWIGPWDESSAFYFRLQSPVILLELDHHAGVFLNNPEPKKFHVHTVIRTPNGNDYGVAVASTALGRQLTLSEP